MKKIAEKISDFGLYLAASATVMVLSTEASAQGTMALTGKTGVGEVSDKVNTSVKPMATLVLAAAFMLGVFLVAAGLLKLKAAAESNGQVKYSEGFWRLGVGGGLVAIPAIIGTLLGTFGYTETNEAFMK